MTTHAATIAALVAERNAAKLLFTAGPASLLTENLTGLRPCFGRGDDDYAAVEEDVLGRLRAMTGHRQIARMQGSASFALEVMARNFLTGRVLVVAGGIYADRLHAMALSASRHGTVIREVAFVPFAALDAVVGTFDWVVACATETSRGFLAPIRALAATARRLGARLMLDATASIGLESDHDLADVVGYSSCKGLFGLTGAAFVAFNEPAAHAADSFSLDLASHLEKRMTGPYHAIASLADVLPRQAAIRESVAINKARFVRDMAAHVTVPQAHQPLLCTHVACDIASSDPRAVLYRPRGGFAGSVVCHLGEAHLGASAKGEILTALHVAEGPSA